MYFNEELSNSTQLKKNEKDTNFFTAVYYFLY